MLGDLARPRCDSVSGCRPEGPWELSPGFSLGCRLVWRMRSEGPRERLPRPKVNCNHERTAVRVRASNDPSDRARYNL
jgi:hypothetical protein